MAAQRQRSRETKHLPIASIVSTPGLRCLKDDAVASLAESMSRVGQIVPITVNLDYRAENPDEVMPAGATKYYVISGRHRLAAAVKLGWTTIECFVDYDADEIQAELWEIDENLCRAELSPAEAAYQTARRKEIYETLHPEAASFAFKGNQHTGEVTDKLSFTKDAAAKTGRDERTIRRDAARGEALGDALKDIAGTSLDKGVELDALAKLPESERQDIVARAKNGESISARALKAIKPATLADEPLNDFEAKEKQVAALMAAWNKAGKEAREEFMDRVGAAPVMDRRWG